VSCFLYLQVNICYPTTIQIKPFLNCKIVVIKCLILKTMSGLKNYYINGKLRNSALSQNIFNTSFDTKVFKLTVKATICQTILQTIYTVIHATGYL
jgi:hypothetical protein